MKQWSAIAVVALVTVNDDPSSIFNTLSTRPFPPYETPTPQSPTITRTSQSTKSPLFSHSRSTKSLLLSPSRSTKSPLSLSSRSTKSPRLEPTEAKSLPPLR
jgi:hypothetical protein